MDRLWSLFLSVTKQCFYPGNIWEGNLLSGDSTVFQINKHLLSIIVQNTT